MYGFTCERRFNVHESHVKYVYLRLFTSNTKEKDKFLGNFFLIKMTKLIIIYLFIDFMDHSNLY